MKIRLFWVLVLLTTFSLPAMRRTVSVNDIIKKYNISKDYCYPAINKRSKRNFPLNDNQKIACVIAGFKDVFFDDPKMLEKMDPDFNLLLKENNIKQIIIKTPDKYNRIKKELIMYTPKGERNALLLAKNLLEMYWGEIMESRSPESRSYLLGFLLGYQPEDIEFFDKIWEFHYRYSNFLDKQTVTFLPNSAFAEWPEEDKIVFSIFEKRVWNESPQGKKFKEDKKRSEEWIKQNNQFSNDQLEKQIDQLQLQLMQSPVD